MNADETAAWADMTGVWAEYIAYILAWADDHAEPEFYGMSPASFDEWYNNEREESV